MDDALIALVHSPLIGPRAWEPLARSLSRLERKVTAPAFTDVFDRPGPYYPAIAASVAGQIAAIETDAPVMLVAHSGAGALLPAIAERAPRVAGAVFVDALLPHPGRSWFATAPEALRGRLLELAEDGRLPKWSDWFGTEAMAELLPQDDQRHAIIAELPKVPLSYFEEEAPAARSWPPGRCAYIRLSDAYTEQEAEARNLGWTVRVLPSDHLAIVTRPLQIAELIASVIDSRR